jgi:hypothetical protein
MCEWERMIERGPNDIDLGRNDKGWVLHVSDIGLSDLLHFRDIGCSDVDLGPSDRRWVT